MRFSTSFVMAPLALAAACASMTAATLENPNRIMDEETFRAEIVDREILVPNASENTWSIASDGTLAGLWRGEAYTGTWRWEDGFFCREVRFETRSTPDDCQVFLIEGDEVTVVRERGAGEAFTVRRKS